jgi:hypothetical protein
MARVETVPAPIRHAPKALARPSAALRFDELLAAVAILLPVVVSLRLSLATVDLAYLVRSGGVMLDTHHLLRTDVFTFTMRGRPWLNQQWGAEIPLAMLYRAGGWELLAIARAALAATAFAFVYAACRARGATRRASSWLTIASLVVSTYGLVLRPQMFAFVLFAATTWIVATAPADPRRLWVLPVLAIAWANLHGSFFLIPLLLGLTWLENVRRRPELARNAIAAAVASVITVAVNPYGFRVWEYVVSLSANADLRRSVSEWRPPYLMDFGGGMFYLSAIAVALYLFSVRRRLTWARVVSFAAFLAMAATTQRAIVWWTLATPFLLADLLDPRLERVEPRRILNTGVVVLLVGLAVTFMPWFRPTFASTASSISTTDGLLAFAPGVYSQRVAAVTEPGARLFVAQAWASWFELALPQDPVMVDPRIELFTRAIWRDYRTISDGEPSWQQVADRWHIDALVLSRLQQQDLIDALGSHPGWDEIYRDDEGLVLVRSPR